MPQKRNNTPPPEVMTWGKATPVLVVAAVFDALGFMFDWFIFFGPAFAALYCTIKIGDTIGTTAAGAVCTLGAGVAGVFGAELSAPFGMVMAMIISFAGWLAVLIILLVFNGRIFKENALWFGASLILTEIPFVGSLPFLTATVWKMYRTQIRIEKEAHAKWKKENADAELQERQRQNVQLMQTQAMQQQELDAEWSDQMSQQENQEETEDEEGRAIAQATLPHLRFDTNPSPSGHEMPPHLPHDSGAMPPPLPTQVWSPDRGVPPPLLPPPLPMQIVSATKERTNMNSDERSVEQVMLRNNAFIVHTMAESGQAQHHNANSNVSGKATYGDDMDIMLAFEPSVSASSVTPGKKSKLWTGDGFILGGGQISEAGGSDQGTVAHGIKRRGDRTSSLEEIDGAVGRNSELHKRDYDRIGTFGMNEIVVNNSEVFGFFQQAEKDADGRYWMFSAETKKDSEMAKRMRKYRPTAFDNNLGNYRRRFATAQERGLPLYIMTPEREVYEALGVNDDGTVEVGKQLTPEEVAKGRAGLSAEKRKKIGERILKKNIFRKDAIQKEAEEIIKSLDKEIHDGMREAE
jgi:hypothetical protein